MNQISEDKTHKDNLINIFKLKKVPILQNKVYTNLNESKNCSFGELDIVYDKEKEYVYNHSFDANIMNYDNDYDNNVPSKVFMDYYDEIAEYLVNNYDLKNGTVIDIGCGKGTFIKNLVSKYDYVKAIGIDPSYVGEKYINNRLSFVDEYFNEDHISNIGNVSIILCRHVLEHIQNPATFLKTIFMPLEKLKNIPIFIEVPDLDWIIENGAFWDFCYEHVNYFTQQSLYNCIQSSNAYVKKLQKSFNGQYLWSESVINTTTDKKISLSINSTNFSNLEFSNDINKSIELIKILSKNKKIVIWGMATKGVMYSLHLLNNNISIDSCVDINVNKQNRYSPLSGFKINHPDVLKKNTDYLIICMNSNYSKEINQQCLDLELTVTLVDPSGNLI